MDTVAARTGKYSVEGPVLYLAFEPGNKEWKLGFSSTPQGLKSTPLKSHNL
jgi:hypothetical protein